MSKLIVISSDAMIGEDLEYFKHLPSYIKYFKGGAEITNVSSIYPSVTFPAHATMMTGMYPDRHGVFSNMQLIPGSDPTPWNWNYNLIKCTDIFRAAKSMGKTTAAIFWPVTACNPSIDYHIADYWAQGEGDTTEEAFARTGTNPEVMKIVKKNKFLFEGVERNHPERDEFGIACAADILRQFSPDLLMVHPANIDGARHEAGVFGPHINHSLDDLDRWVKMLVESSIEAGTWEETNIFLVSDHGQREVRRNIGLNVLLVENGFIQLALDGSIADWDAYCQSNGMSALIYLKDKNNKGMKQKVLCFLQKLLDEGVYGFSKIYTEEETREQERLGGEFAFVLETDGYSAFGDYYTRPLVRELSNSDYRFGRATHGYLPQEGPQPILLAKGPNIRENISLSGSHIIHEAPTYARILGVELPNTDGKAIMEILK